MNINQENSTFINNSLFSDKDSSDAVIDIRVQAMSYLMYKISK